MEKFINNAPFALVLVILVIGFVLLIKGADFFVEGSSSVAKRLHVPSIIIGLTIVAMGTSLPETAVSVSASITGNNELAVSNVVGSNIFNLMVVIGVCAVVFTIVALGSVRGDLAPFAAALHSGKFVTATIFLSVFCSVAANILVNYSASVLPMAIFSNLGSLITVCAMFLGVIFLKEPVNAMSLMGSGLVLLGLFLIARTNHAPQREDQTAPGQEKPEEHKPSSC